MILAPIASIVGVGIGNNQSQMSDVLAMLSPCQYRVFLRLSPSGVRVQYFLMTTAIVSASASPRLKVNFDMRTKIGCGWWLHMASDGCARFVWPEPCDGHYIK